MPLLKPPLLTGSKVLFVTTLFSPGKHTQARALFVNFAFFSPVLAKLSFLHSFPAMFFLLDTVREVATAVSKFSFSAFSVDQELSFCNLDQFFLLVTRGYVTFFLLYLKKSYNFFKKNIKL